LDRILNGLLKLFDSAEMLWKDRFEAVRNHLARVWQKRNPRQDQDSMGFAQKEQSLLLLEPHWQRKLVIEEKDYRRSYFIKHFRVLLQ
jgi:hypothetical protein